MTREELAWFKTELASRLQGIICEYEMNRSKAKNEETHENHSPYQGGENKKRRHFSQHE